MGLNWRSHRVIAYCVLALIAVVLLGLFGTDINGKVFGIGWKYVLLAGTGYLAWALNKMLHF